MKAAVAIDSFKGSLTSSQAGKAAAEGIIRVYPDAEVEICVLADGGEGTMEALISGMNGKKQRIFVTGPLGKKTVCEYGIAEHGQTAIMEMASAAGITLLKKEERNPLFTTTYGVGEMILDAVKKGCTKFLIGIGGSATNDGGIGMLQALGYGFLDRKGNQVPFGAQGLEKIERITDEGVIPELKKCHFTIACDVTNPLCGVEGCSAVYGPQKGADQDMMEQMDRWMEKYADLAEKSFPKADKKYPGAGAAGGLGFAFLTFLDSILKSGVQIVLEKTGIEQKIKEADVVVTGEGHLDGQTAMGKAPIGIAKLAKKYQKPVIAFSGSAAREARACNKYGIDAFFPILRQCISLEEAMQPKQAADNLADTAEQVFRLWKIKEKEE
ncbi:MAG: glycerate kinase [Eubacteriales bacterium]|nr:glycerate kinase [Eubacteriales bacterium]